MDRDAEGLLDGLDDGAREGRRAMARTAVRDALGEAADRFAFSEAGFKQLKGYAKPVPVLRVRRA